MGDIGQDPRDNPNMALSEHGAMISSLDKVVIISAEKKLVDMNSWGLYSGKRQ